MFPSYEKALISTRFSLEQYFASLTNEQKEERIDSGISMMKQLFDAKKITKKCYNEEIKFYNGMRPFKDEL